MFTMTTAPRHTIFEEGLSEKWWPGEEDQHLQVLEWAKENGFVRDSSKDGRETEFWAAGPNTPKDWQKRVEALARFSGAVIGDNLVGGFSFYRFNIDTPDPSTKVPLIDLPTGWLVGQLTKSPVWGKGVVKYESGGFLALEFGKQYGHYIRPENPKEMAMNLSLRVGPVADGSGYVSNMAKKYGGLVARSYGNLWAKTDEERQARKELFDKLKLEKGQIVTDKELGKMDDIDELAKALVKRLVKPVLATISELGLVPNK